MRDNVGVSLVRVSHSICFLARHFAKIWAPDNSNKKKKKKKKKRRRFDNSDLTRYQRRYDADAGPDLKTHSIASRWIMNE
jgi:hypothetical protein